MVLSNCDIVLNAANRLVSKAGSAEKLQSLQVARERHLSGGWCWMALPDWAADLVPAGLGGIYVPAQTDAPTWQEYDWWLGAATLLTAAFERQHEAQNGPVHSYLFRLQAEFKPAVRHAWVNRIVMFLRRWWAHENAVPEESAFGPMPEAIVHLTHDVDAVSKTIAIRGKQAAFNLYNKRFSSALRFLLGPADYWRFDEIMRLEDHYGRRSAWNFYGARGGLWRTPKEHLFDPGYDVCSSRLMEQIKAMSRDGHQIGLHPRFDTWQCADRMRAEKQTIEKALGHEITTVRQHWLRFSFADTWTAQKAAGLAQDYTLGFNDSPGFRNSAALSFVDAKSGMRIIPMVLMDSHLYDYADLTTDKRCQTIDRVLDELCFTGGEASIIWHHRVFHPDYGWGGGYEYLLEGMKKRGIASPKVV